LRRAISSFGLLEEGELPCQPGEPRVGCDVGLLQGGCAGGDESCIEPVVLGAAQVQAGVGLDLDRLHEEHGEALLAQMFDHAALIAAAGFDADAAYAEPAQLCGQATPALLGIVYLPAVVAAVHGDVELGFRCIDTGRYARVGHLPRPRLASEPESSGNHPGPMKVLARSRYVTATMAEGANDPIASCSAADGRLRQSVPFGTGADYPVSL
jgi:hypothetical protein